MRFKVKYITNSTIDLFDYVQKANSDVMLILAPGEYTFTPGANNIFYKSVVIVGDPRNSFKHTSVKTAAMGLNTNSANNIFLFENLTLYHTYIDYTFSNLTRTLFNRVWFHCSSIVYYDRFETSTTSLDTIVKFMNCRLPEPSSYSNTHPTVFTVSTFSLPMENTPFKTYRCTYPDVAPQFKYIDINNPGDHIHKFYRESSLVSDNTTPVKLLENGKTKITTPITVLEGSETSTNLISNLLDGSSLTYWEASAGDYAVLDLGSSLGIGEIKIRNSDYSPIRYEIKVSEDLSQWYKVISADLSADIVKIHDLFGYKSRYIVLHILNTTSEKVRLVSIDFTLNNETYDFVEVVPGFGPQSGPSFYTERMNEPIKIRGTVQDQGVLLDNNQLTFFSTNVGKIVGTTTSTSGGNFEFVVPEEYLGHQFEIFGRYNNKKIQISKVLAPVRDCSSGYLFNCVDRPECEKNGGEWIDNLCWEKREPCASPYYNCPDKTSCEEIGGNWWDTVRDCWGPNHKKVIAGKEKVITPVAAIKMGGYLVGGYLGEIHHSDYNNFHETFSGITGQPPDSNKWNSGKLFYGSLANLNVYSALIDSNKLWLKYQSINTTKTSYGIDSGFTIHDGYGVFELDYSDVTVSAASVYFFFGVQNFNRDSKNDFYMKGIFINNTGIHAGILHEHIFTVWGTLARGTSGTLRLSVTKHNISVSAKVDTNNWVHIASSSIITHPLSDDARIRLSWTSTAVGIGNIKVSNFKVISGNLHPKSVAQQFSIARSAELCRAENGYWDKELGACCPNQDYLIDFSSFPDEKDVNLTNSRLYSDNLLQSRVIDGKFRLSTKFESISGGVDYWNGSLSIEKFELTSIYEPFEYIVPFEITKIMDGYYSNYFYPLKIQVIFNGISGGTNFVAEMGIKYGPWINYYSYYMSTTIATSSGAVMVTSLPTSGKLKIQRSVYGGPIEGFYWNGSSWILVHSKLLTPSVSQFDYNSLSFKVSSTDEMNHGTSTSPRYLQTDISSISIKTPYSPCSSCIDHPITTCIEKEPCISGGGFWQNQTAKYDSAYRQIDYCKKTPPNCLGDSNQCYDESDCTNAEFFWYDNKCNKDRKASCSNKPSLCLNQNDCVSNGHYWYNNKCNMMIEPKCHQLYSSCKNRIACEEQGFYWNGSTCNPTTTCFSYDLPNCLYQKECEIISGHYWYNNRCNFGNSPTERALSTLGLNPVFYVNFSGKNSLTDMINKKRILTKIGNPLLIRSELMSEGGVNFCYSLTQTDSKIRDSFSFNDFPVILLDDFTIEMAIKSETIEEKEFSVKYFSFLGDINNICYLSVSQFQLMFGTNIGEYSLSLPFSREANIWYHIVLTRKNGSTQVFLNGQPGQALICNDSIQFSGIGYNKQGIFKGLVDEISIYTHAFDYQTIADRSLYVVSSS